MANMVATDNLNTVLDLMTRLSLDSLAHYDFIRFSGFLIRRLKPYTSIASFARIEFDCTRRKNLSESPCFNEKMLQDSTRTQVKKCERHVFVREGIGGGVGGRSSIISAQPC